MNNNYSTLIEKSIALLNYIETKLTALQPLGDLLLRCWLAYTFWVSGLLKLQNWDSTLYLFEYEYAVPLIPTEYAAVLGTAVEVCAPVLLALGFCGRGAALLLFLFNIIAMISYPDLGSAGIEQHKVWGLMLFVCLVHGAGKWSVDGFLTKKYSNNFSFNN